jgi:hypothetical protein
MSAVSDGRARATTCRGRATILALVSASLITLSGIGVGVARADEIVHACQTQLNYAFGALANGGQFSAPLACPLQITSTGETMGRGTSARWEATAPTGLSIVGANVRLTSHDVNAGSTGQYGGGFVWGGGGGAQISPGETTFTAPASLNSPSFGFFIVCGLSSCNQAGANITLYSAALTVREAAPPTVSSATFGLWPAGGWVRGTWSLAWSGDSATGVCTLNASLAGQALPIESVAPDGVSWKQCEIPYGTWLGDQVVTSAYPDGADPVRIGATDAAGESSSASETVHIDNQPPTVAITGPGDAPATSGTQYVTATATAGPSGVYGIDCSVDGAAGQWYPASSAQIPVSGIGEHQVSCYAENNAVDEHGVHGISTTQTFAIKLGVPTIAAIGFNKLVNGLRCHRFTERVRIPARWVTVTVRHQRVRVHERAHSQRIRVTRCHVRTARRRVTVWVTARRHGHKVRVRRHKIVRVALVPHTVTKRTRTVRHGQATTVNGWVGTATGVALAGQTVDIYTAADNARNNYHLATTATTAANGTWSARIGRGPSRLIRAYYPGPAQFQAAESAPVTLLVPAKIRLLRITPSKVAWGGTVRITGRLEGGYIPPGGTLVRLRIGEGSAAATYGVREHVGGHHGLFTTTYTFGAGEPAVHRAFWFELASLPMGNYPYAPADSNRRTVTVGGHPPAPRKPTHRRHHRRRRPG